MKYTVNVKGTEFQVDGLDFGVDKGSPTGNIDLYLTIKDGDRDIYTVAEKKKFWTKWVNDCCGDNGKPQDRIRRVEAKVWGGDTDDQVWRTIVIDSGYIASFKEISDRGRTGSKTTTMFEYQVTIKRAPNREGEVSVKAG